MVKLVSISVFGGNSKFLVTEKRFQERENFLLLLKLHKRLVRQKGSQVRIQCSILFLLNQSFCQVRRYSLGVGPSDARVQFQLEARF